MKKNNILPFFLGYTWYAFAENIIRIRVLWRRAMEKNWEEFYRTGKITDYLEYRNSIKEDTRNLKEYKSDDAGSCTNRHGFDSNAN